MTMIENRKDKKETKRLRKLGVLEDPKSYVTFAGHLYARGADRIRLHAALLTVSGGICAICKKRCSPLDGDMDHIVGGNGPQRCDCFHRKLADGTRHTNLQWVHGMWSTEPCHRRKHHREV
jgi:hypothetical protein